MEFGVLEREVFVGAGRDVVFAVVSRAEHVREWWPDEARFEAVPGAVGEIGFGDPADGGQVAGFSVVEVRPPSLFSFRWTQPAGETGVEGDSLLVTFELEEVPGGTRLKMTETGFRERGWEAAVLEETYRDHENGWDFFLPRLVPYAEKVAAGS